MRCPSVPQMLRRPGSWATRLLTWRRWVATRTFGSTKTSEVPMSASTSASKPWLSRKGRKIDFAERDARNRRLGQLGEKFVLDLVRKRLRSAGRDDLARKVLWVSRDLGDNLGYDILSYNDGDDSEQLLEVKTTGSGKFSAFYVTETEVRCSA